MIANHMRAQGDVVSLRQGVGLGSGSAKQKFEVVSSSDKADILADKLIGQLHAGATTKELAAFIRAELSGVHDVKPVPAVRSDCWVPRVTWLGFHPDGEHFGNCLHLFRGYDASGRALVRVQGILQAVHPERMFAVS